MTLSTPARGRYVNLLREGTNIAILDPDLARHFPDSEAVNSALRAFLAIGQQVESVSAHNVRKSPRPSESKRSGFDPRVGTSLKRRAAGR